MGSEKMSNILDYKVLAELYIKLNRYKKMKKRPILTDDEQVGIRNFSAWLNRWKPKLVKWSTTYKDNVHD